MCKSNTFLRIEAGNLCEVDKTGIEIPFDYR